MTYTSSYPAGTRWTFRSRSDHSVLAEELVLSWQAENTTSDDLPDEITAAELWESWHKAYLRDDQALIRWSVTTPQLRGVFDAAPFQMTELVCPGEDFLRFYTWPRHAESGEPVNWLRLPVLDVGWAGDRADKGGFIQEATGWKPSPLQPVFYPQQVASACAP